MAQRSAVLVSAGFAGLLFLSGFVALGAIARGYDPMRDTISALEFTQVGWLQQINFAVFGCLLLIFAAALRQILISGRGALAIPLFQSLSGLAVIGDGIFIRNPMHMTCDLIAFNCTLLVLVLFSWRFRSEPHWKGWSLFSLVTAIAMMGFLTAFGYANGHGGPAGLMEKLATATRTVWSVAFTWRVLSGKGFVAQARVPQEIAERRIGEA